MRINNPRLFNGDLLATYSKLAQMFGLNYDDKGFTGTIDINRIPISALVNKDITGYINAGNLLVGDLTPSGIQFEQLSGITSGVTILSALNIIDEKFESQQNAIDAVKQYDVEEGDLINVISASVTDETTGITTDTFTVSVDQAELSGKFDLQKLTTESGFASQYQLTYNGQQIGNTIDIPRDQFLKTASYITSSEVLRLEFQLDSENPETEAQNYVDIPVGDLVDEYSAGNGIQIEDNIDGKNIISIELNNSEDNKFINLTADGLGLSGITAAITGAVDQAPYAQIVNLTEEFTATSASITTGYLAQPGVETRKKTLFVDQHGQTALYIPAEDEGETAIPSSILDISQEYITEVSGVTSGNFEKLMTVQATSGYVAEQIQKAVFNDPDAAGLVAATRVTETISTEIPVSGIPTIGAVSSYVADEVDAVKETVRTEIEPKAIEMREVSAYFGIGVSASVSGRVIAVYDRINYEQVYPTIKYDKETGFSTLFADVPSAVYDIIYAKRIGQNTGVLPEYDKPENSEPTEG